MNPLRRLHPNFWASKQMKNEAWRYGSNVSRLQIWLKLTFELTDWRHSKNHLFLLIWPQQVISVKSWTLIFFTYHIHLYIFAWKSKTCVFIRALSSRFHFSWKMFILNLVTIFDWKQVSWFQKRFYNICNIEIKYIVVSKTNWSYIWPRSYHQSVQYLN